jgi:hypothetical protein
VVRERDLAGARDCAAADQPRVADRVVRRAEGPLGDEARPARQARDRVNFRQLQRGLEFERRKDGGEPLGEHRLARTRRADEQNVMSTGRRDFQRALGGELAAHLAEVNRVVALRREQARVIDFERRGRAPFGERGDEFDRAAQGRHRVNGDARDDRRLRRVLFRQDEHADAGGAGAQRDGQRAAHGAHAPVEREFAQGDGVGQAVERAQVAVRAQHPERDGQVEGRALLAHVGRGQVDRRLVEREEEAAVVDRSPYALARLAHGGVGQPDDGDGRVRLDLVARGRQVNFDVNEVCVEPLILRKFVFV